MFHNRIHTAAARTLMQSSLQLREILYVSSRNNLDMPILGIPHPAAQPNLRRLSLHKPAKPDALHASFDKVMAHHRSSSVAERPTPRNNLKQKEKAEPTGSASWFFSNLYALLI
jgi:hypothetical protein